MEQLRLSHEQLEDEYGMYFIYVLEAEQHSVGYDEMLDMGLDGWEAWHNKLGIVRSKLEGVFEEERSTWESYILDRSLNPNERIIASNFLLAWSRIEWIQTGRTTLGASLDVAKNALKIHPTPLTTRWYGQLLAEWVNNCLDGEEPLIKESDTKENVLAELDRVHGICESELAVNSDGFYASDPDRNCVENLSLARDRVSSSVAFPEPNYSHKSD